MTTAQRHLALDLVLVGLTLWALQSGHELVHVGTGRLLHLWVGSLLGVAVAVHLVVHRRWLAQTTARLGRGLSGEPRSRTWLALLVAGSFGLALVSGVIAAFAESGLRPEGWTLAHHASVKIAALAAALHLVKHGRWVAHTLGSFVKPSAPSPE